MLLQAANEHVLDLASSVMVGDKSSDMEAAHAAGVPNRVLVRSGQKISESCQALATHVVDSLAEVPTTLGLK